MRLIVLTKDQTDYTREVDEYLFEFKRRTGHDLEVINPESSAGISFTEAYDILEFPTIIAISDDGRVQNSWKGLPLPTMSELSYYTQ